MGHEFTSLVLALLHTGGHPIKLEAETIEQIAELNSPLDVEIFISLSCQNMSRSGSSLQHDGSD
ncbi:alkyl hydroperoxide reductase protein F [Vibrio variabilis]|uniref:Alkyl hydroperoxide reductase protein F n=1 Tax=Vibrio variabilis TaxID=990271 RepID=A0ABQ0J735_9VIBR|nr:alkyl hydroperoxide reductase protein F [Vibrio variabilis]